MRTALQLLLNTKTTDLQNREAKACVNINY